MNFIRSVLFFIWLALWLIPLATGLLITSIFVRGDRLYWWFMKPYLELVIGFARIVGGVKYRVHGLHLLPEKSDNQRIVLAAKHQSTWETFAFSTIMPHPLSYVFKKELLMIPLFGWALARLDMVHIDRSKRKEAWLKVAEQGRELMDRGRWIIMFPEGTRCARGEVGSYKQGAARLAVETGASIVPIAVTSARCWPRRSFSLRPGTIDVSIGEPIASEGQTPEALTRQVKNWIETEMRRLDPEAYS